MPHEKYVSRTFTHEEIKRFLHATEWRLLVSGRERKLIYAILLSTGMRSSELQKVTLDQVIFDHEYPHIRLNPKATKYELESLIPIPRILIEPLKEWVDERIKGGGRLLFERMKTLRQNFHRDIEYAGLSLKDEKGRLRRIDVLRVTSAALLCEAGVDQTTILALLGLNYRLTAESINRTIGLKELSEAVNRIPDMLNP